MKDRIRANFAIGLSKRCIDAWWDQIERIRSGEVSRSCCERDEGHFHGKQQSMAKRLGMNHGHLSRILSSKAHDWPLLLLFVFDLGIETQELTFPSQINWMCYGYAESVRGIDGPQQQTRNRCPIDEMDIAYLAAMLTSDKWREAMQAENEQKAQEKRRLALPEISRKVRNWLGIRLERTRDVSALIELERSWGRQFKECVNKLPLRDNLP